MAKLSYGYKPGPNGTIIKYEIDENGNPTGKEEIVNNNNAGTAKPVQPAPTPQGSAIVSDVVITNPGRTTLKPGDAGYKAPDPNAIKAASTATPEQKAQYQAGKQAQQSIQSKIPGMQAQQDYNDASAAYINQFKQGINTAKDFIKEGDLGRVEDKRAQEVNDLLAKLAAQAEGMNSAEMLAAQELANANINAELQGKLGQMAAIQGAQGLVGGVAASQQMGLLNQAIKDKILAEKQMMLENIALKNQGLAQYGNALYEAQGKDIDTQKYNIGQQNAEKFGQLSLGSNISAGITGMQQAKDNKALAEKQNKLLQDYLNKIGLNGKAGGATTADGIPIEQGAKDKFGDPVKSVEKNGKSYTLYDVENSQGHEKYYDDKFYDEDGNLYVDLKSYNKDAPIESKPYNPDTDTFGGGSAPPPKKSAEQVKQETEAAVKETLEKLKSQPANEEKKEDNGKVICTAVCEAGGIKSSQLLISRMYAKRFWPLSLHKGYLVWGRPIANLVRRSTFLRKMITPMVRLVIAEEAFKLGLPDSKSSLIGKLLLNSVEMISKTINKLR